MRELTDDTKMKSWNPGRKIVAAYFEKTSGRRGNAEEEHYYKNMEFLQLY